MSSKKITKLVVPCAGMGTRFLPITKSLPKELLPIIDTPVLQYIVDEAVASGITDILLIINQSKLSIKHFFSRDNNIEAKLLDAGKTKEAELLKKLNNTVNFSFEYQEVPKGSGDAVLYAKNFVGKDAFALAWGDDLMISHEPVIGQLATAYDKYGTSILGVQQVLTDDIVKYGVPAISKQEGKSCLCTEIIEKPPLDKIASRFASLGRYILHNEIFDEIVNSRDQNTANELHLTTALNSLAKKERLWTYDFEGTRFDMGDKFGALKANIYLGKQRFGKELDNYMKTIID